MNEVLEELVRMIEDCPNKDGYLSEEFGCGICCVGTKPHCVTAVSEGMCCNDEIAEYYDEHEDELDYECEETDS